MPPKRAVLIQTIRDAYNEDASYAAIEAWTNTAIAQGEAVLQSATAAREGVEHASYSAPGSARSTPQPVLDVLRSFRAFAREAYIATERIRTVIGIRVPEIKEEDNHGVNVQMTVLCLLDSFEAKLSGAGGDKECKAGSAAGVFIVKDYLSSRSGVEEKILGKAGGSGEGQDKPSEGTRAPSAILELQQVDADVMLRIELAMSQILTCMRCLINVYVLNWKKLIQPRVNMNERMMS